MHNSAQAAYTYNLDGKSHPRGHATFAAGNHDAELSKGHKPAACFAGNINYCPQTPCVQNCSQQHGVGTRHPPRDQHAQPRRVDCFAISFGGITNAA